jgi:hypothetical protein
MTMQDDGRFRLQVDCYAGYRGEETPKRFRIGSTTVEIEAILDRWLAPDHRYFKVRGRDQAEYILRHDGAADVWELTMYRDAQARNLSVKEDGGPGGAS